MGRQWVTVFFTSNEAGPVRICPKKGPSAGSKLGPPSGRCRDGGIAARILETHEDWLNRVHPDDRARAERQFLETLNGLADRYSSEYRIIRPDNGQTRWIAAEGLIERRPDGKPLRMVGAHIDITERALSKELLRESEERFRLIANSAPVPMWVSHLDRSRAFANQAYVEFLGVGYEGALAFGPICLEMCRNHFSK
jgi:PAS domain-containing protein